MCFEGCGLLLLACSIILSTLGFCVSLYHINHILVTISYTPSHNAVYIVLIHTFVFQCGQQSWSSTGFSSAVSWCCLSVYTLVSVMTWSRFRWSRLECCLKIFQKHFQVHQLVRTTSSSHLTSHSESCV